MKGEPRLAAELLPSLEICHRSYNIRLSKNC